MADDEKPTEENQEAASSEAESLQQEELKDQSAEGQKNSIDFLLDVPLNMSVELGRSKMLVNDLLQLGQGSVVELNKIVGEPLEVLVNEKLIARGEVVTLNDKFAVRLTDILSPTDRVEQLT